ncbi:MAG: metallophosphoesterase [Synergistaceae bacterium]|jgi:predicted MPP superfamily phosphohydrolase|nr:metallophosphoesterase [Synergistaceae bacterium]
MFYNKKAMILFTASYLAALFYTGFHLSELLLGNRRPFEIFALWILFGASLPLGFLRKKYVPILTPAGGVALAFVCHLSGAFLILDAWRLSSFAGLLPLPSSRDAAILLNGALLWIAWGVVRAQRIRVRTLEVRLPSDRPHPPLRAAAAMDIHAGGVAGRRYLRRLKALIEGCRPDIILLAGDVTDGNLSRAVRAGLKEILASLRAPLGKYAVLGNHDIYAGAEDFVSLMRDAGVTVLRDEARIVDGAFILAGRNDPRGIHFGISRAPLAQVLQGQPDLPLVVIDHTPRDLEEAEACGVDLQLSGHTHGGQVFPLNLVMKRLYGISSGVLRKGKTLICVSSGAGLWVMPTRTVTNSEILLCRITFVSKTSGEIH